MKSHDDSYDVIVVGAGAAGLAAALTAVDTASQSGTPPRVALIERSSRELRGGNTRYSGSYLRLKEPTAPVDDLVEYGISASGGRASRAYYETLAQRVPETFSWLQENGVELAQLPTIFLTSSAPRYQPVGGGAHLVNQLFHVLEGTEIDVHYETAAQRLVMDERDEVRGLVVRSAAGARTLHAPAVILACGGFQANEELMTRYIGPSSRNVPPISKGGRNNKGDGLRMAMEVGAATTGQFDLFHAEPKDPRSDIAEAVVMTYPYGLLVDKNGDRFTDEGVTTVDLSYEAVARTIATQPAGIGYAIFDQRIVDVEGREHAVRTEVDPIESQTLAGLASGLGIPVDTFEATVAGYNQACPADETTFDWSRQDGLAAHPIGQPPKSNWARKLDRGPYFAYPLICSNVFTFGGVSTDLDAHVVTADNHVIDGLYGAGEMTGLYYGSYAGSTSVMRSLTFGRTAGRLAIKERAAS